MQWKRIMSMKNEISHEGDTGILVFDTIKGWVSELAIDMT